MYVVFPSIHRVYYVHLFLFAVMLECSSPCLLNQLWHFIFIQHSYKDLYFLFIWESEFSMEFFTFADPNYYHALLDTLSNSDEHLLSI